MRTLSLAVALAAGLASIAHAQPANDSCFAPEPIFGFGSIFFSTVDAETDGEPSPSCLFFGQEQVYRDIWFRWSPDESGLVRIGLCDSDFDTKIAIYSGYPKGGCPDPSAVIACNDDSCGLRSVVTFFAEAGVVYAIRLGSYGTPASGGSTGSGTMVIFSGTVDGVSGTAAFAGSIDAFGTPDAVPGDLNGDGIVNGADLAILLGSWGDGGVPADLNGDGIVNGADLSILLGEWGANK